MNRWLDIFVRTLAIALAMVALGWILGLVLPSEEVTEGEESWVRSYTHS